jgi:hypothetical protein
MPELPYGSRPVPATPIGELKRWQLDIRCSRCRQRVPLPIRDLIETYGHGLRIGDLVRRLRCSGLRDGKLCRAPPSQVVLIEVSDTGRLMRKVREIVVVGHR